MSKLFSATILVYVLRIIPDDSTTELGPCRTSGFAWCKEKAWWNSRTLVFGYIGSTLPLLFTCILHLLRIFRDLHNQCTKPMQDMRGSHHVHMNMELKAALSPPIEIETAQITYSSRKLCKMRRWCAHVQFFFFFFAGVIIMFANVFTHTQPFNKKKPNSSDKILRCRNPWSLFVCTHTAYEQKAWSHWRRKNKQHLNSQRCRSEARGDGM